jgi:hypothetical protein
MTIQLIASRLGGFADLQPRKPTLGSPWDRDQE